LGEERVSICREKEMAESRIRGVERDGGITPEKSR